MSKLITIQNMQLPVIEYQNKRVITTKILAQDYGATEKRFLITLFKMKVDFIEGKHYYLIKRDERQSIKRLPSFKEGLVSKYASQLILWIEREAFRHAKILETDKAWDWYKALEDNYFTQATIQKNPTLTRTADYLNFERPEQYKFK
ncbi:MAG TPA: ORF6N domain-containing protein [Arsenophonus sp.]